ncbi:MAG: GDP-mannose 4,6-dehydratase [Chloroflexi bacterium]|nr:GDP-mannose 4,6-dehydratase [Chloroflexota bacterium]
MRVLITGISGFAGSYLAEYLLGLETHPAAELWGVSQHGGEHPPTDARISFVHGDLTDPRFTAALLAQVSPDRIYHLAAQAFVPISWQDPWATLENNIRAETNLLHTAARQKLNARLLVVGSNEEYGRVTPADLPIDEDTPLRPDSPYGVSKITQDFLGLQYFLSHQLHVVRMRPFNHIGPRQSERFVAASFAKQVAEMEAGVRAKKLRVGNLDAQRDFTDVRDTVRGYVLALERGQAGEVYNLGSGKPRAIRELVEIYQHLARVPFEIEYDPERMRPSDTPVSYCDASKLKNATGWEPQIPFEQTLRDILDYWRGRVANGESRIVKRET